MEYKIPMTTQTPPIRAKERMIKWLKGYLFRVILAIIGEKSYLKKIPNNNNNKLKKLEHKFIEN